jgi:transcriptional regulator with XRE-family HTH domain
LHDSAPSIVDRSLGDRLIRQIGRELREARRSFGLSADAVGRAAGCSGSFVRRVERAEVRGVSVIALARFGAILGLDLNLRLFPGGSPMRDAAQLGLIPPFRSHLHPTLRWSTEVPFPIVGDRRAWDGMVQGSDWRYGVELESAPSDAQAITRRCQLKHRDGGVDGVLLVVPDTQRARAFVHTMSAVAGDTFPVPSRDALNRLRRGQDPGGSAIVIVRKRDTRRREAGT